MMGYVSFELGSIVGARGEETHLDLFSRAALLSSAPARVSRLPLSFNAHVPLRLSRSTDHEFVPGRSSNCSSSFVLSSPFRFLHTLWLPDAADRAEPWSTATTAAKCGRDAATSVGQSGRCRCARRSAAGSPAITSSAADPAGRRAGRCRGASTSRRGWSTAQCARAGGSERITRDGTRARETGAGTEESVGLAA